MRVLYTGNFAKPLYKGFTKPICASYTHFGLFPIDMWRFFTKPFREGVLWRPLGMCTQYIHTYTHFGLFSYRYGGGGTVKYQKKFWRNYIKCAELHKNLISNHPPHGMGVKYQKLNVAWNSMKCADLYRKSCF